MASIVLHDLSLHFRIRQYRHVSLKEYCVQSLFRRKRNPIMNINALCNVNLHIENGDRLGIIGHNGAGKSTLLKVIAGIYPPTSGDCVVDGEISSLFDLALGFEPEASGWENVAFRGYLQGETPRSIKDKMASVAAFSEIADYMDTPVRFYSDGMRLRLAFSIATAIEPEILLVDEVLSAGDRAFQKKARQRMSKMVEQAKLIVMVSHDLDSLVEFCNRAVWMDHGSVRHAGPIDDVVAMYIDETARTKRSAGAETQPHSIKKFTRPSNAGSNAGIRKTA